MKWSWRLFKVAGIGLYVHVTFLLLLLWIGLTSFGARHRWEDALGGLLFVIALFAIVVLHELGHALTARRFGIGTRDITLLPIGGVARLERMPEDPKQELAVALAGPAVNVLLAALIFSILGMTRQLAELNLAGLEPAMLTKENFLSQLMQVNIMLAIFNLLPAFPMDGGRVLRALLATRLNYARATRIAATVGQTMAFGFGMAGLFGNPFLILIALFVWMGAAQEAGVVQLRSLLNGVPVSRVMITEFRALSADDTLGRAVEYLLAGYQEDYPVLTEGKLIGVLTRKALVNGLARLGTAMPVADAMEKEFETTDPGDQAETVFMRLQTGKHGLIAVVQGDQLVGVVTTEHIREYLMVQAALTGDFRERQGRMGMRERTV
jgi:Zn-dependent protease